MHYRNQSTCLEPSHPPHSPPDLQVVFERFKVNNIFLSVPQSLILNIHLPPHIHPALQVVLERYKVYSIFISVPQSLIRNLATKKDGLDDDDDDDDDDQLTKEAAPAGGGQGKPEQQAGEYAMGGMSHHG